VIRGNVVTGIGPTAGAAQNGIQIGFGAGGSIARNTVTNNLWSSCTMASTCQAVATNILVAGSDGVEVSGNTVGNSQVAIFLHGNQGVVEGNQTSATSVFDGIHLEGSQNEVRRNQVFDGAESGIFVSGNNNVVEHNTITEAAIGILKASGSSGNLIRFNQVFGAPIVSQDPALRQLTTLVFAAALVRCL
jgi:parallel beta-helix repeat protein